MYLPEKNYWIKIFSDFTSEWGLDEDIQSNKASWSKGRLSDLVSVSIKQGNKMIVCNAIGEYWQSDDYSCQIGELEPKREIRRIQYRVHENDYFAIEEQKNLLIINKIDSNKIYEFISNGKDLLVVPYNLDSHWLTMEIIQDKFQYSIKEQRI